MREVQKYTKFKNAVYFASVPQSGMQNETQARMANSCDPGGFSLKHDQAFLYAQFVSMRRRGSATTLFIVRYDNP
jgi:hypothetical protein